MDKDNTVKSSYILRVFKGDFNPFTPNRISVDDNHIEYSRRNWHLISVDTESLSFKNIVGITVDNHVFGATIKIKSSGSDPIIISGFWKKEARGIKTFCSNNIAESANKGTADEIAKAVANAVGGAAEGNKLSVADELMKLKELLDSGVLTQDEFDQQKKKLIK